MRDGAPFTETPNTGTPEAPFEDLYPAASGNLAGGPDRPSAPLFSSSAHTAGSCVGQGRLRVILEIAGDCISIACLFFMLFAGLFVGAIQ
ncbi:MAG: hypothetical protein V7695_02840 [Sulfitobacter sp.]